MSGDGPNPLYPDCKCAECCAQRFVKREADGPALLKDMFGIEAKPSGSPTQFRAEAEYVGMDLRTAFAQAARDNQASRLELENVRAGMLKARQERDACELKLAEAEKLMRDALSAMKTRIIEMRAEVNKANEERDALAVALAEADKQRTETAERTNESIDRLTTRVAELENNVYLRTYERDGYVKRISSDREMYASCEKTYQQQVQDIETRADELTDIVIEREAEIRALVKAIARAEAEILAGRKTGGGS
jgi:chromosome segregation ATPase